MNKAKIIDINGYKIKFCDFVYAPELDTYLFLDNLVFTRKKKRLLDMGTGTGILAIYFSKFFESVYAVDINPYAIYCAIQNARLNKVQNIHFILGNLFNSFSNTFTFDTILFNPPYLPIDENHKNSTKLMTQAHKYLNLSWFGGQTGSDVILVFLKQARYYLRSDGEIFFLISSLTKPAQIFKTLREEGYQYTIIHKEKLFFEELLLINAW